MLNRQLTHRKYTWDWDTIAQVILHDCKKNCLKWFVSSSSHHRFWSCCITLTNQGFLCSYFWYMSSLIRSTSSSRAEIHISTARQCGEPGHMGTVTTAHSNITFPPCGIVKAERAYWGLLQAPAYWLNCTVNNNKVPVIMDMTPLFQTIHLHHHSTQVSSIDTQRLQSVENWDWSLHVI